MSNFLNSLKPRQLFLIDSLGALLSAFMLGVILPMFEDFFGMPKQELYYLALAACLFFIYSFTNYLKFNSNWRFWLRIIAIVNLLYCCVTAGLVIYHYPKLSIWGLLYFIFEIIIIITLATIELRIIRSAKARKV